MKRNVALTRKKVKNRCRWKLEGETAKIACESILASMHYALFCKEVFKETQKYTKSFRTVE